MKVARLITTFKCNRDCKDCCNKDAELINTGIKLGKDAWLQLGILKCYPVICITGGEPMLDVSRTVSIIKELREQNPDVIIYLYTALYTPNLGMILPIVDGIQFSIHYGANLVIMAGLNCFQEYINGWSDKSFRLYVDDRVDVACHIQPNLWHRIEVKAWQEKCPLPENETLFILQE